MRVTPLEMFVLVVATTVLGLLLDGALRLFGLPTLTSFVRGGTPLGVLLGVLLVAWQGLGTLSLALHFTGGR